MLKQLPELGDVFQIRLVLGAQLNYLLGTLLNCFDGGRRHNGGDSLSRRHTVPLKYGVTVSYIVQLRLIMLHVIDANVTLNAFLPNITS